MKKKNRVGRKAEEKRPIIKGGGEKRRKNK